MEQSNSRGMFFGLLAVTIFAMQDGISKHLASEYNAPFVIMIRYWAFAAFVVIYALRAKGGFASVARSAKPWLQWLRGAILGGMTIVGITLFARLGLAETHAIFASAPLMVAALSMPMLGERVGWRRWAAIGVGFIGVLLMMQPGAGAVNPLVFVALLMTLSIAIYGVLTRMVSRYDSPFTSFFYTGVGGVVVVSLIGPFYWTSMIASDWAWMAVLSVSGALGHYFLIRAFAEAAAVVVQPLTYVQTVLASAIGVVIFGEVLRFWTVTGAIIVIGAGVFTAWREHVMARRSRIGLVGSGGKGSG